MSKGNARVTRSTREQMATPTRMLKMSGQWEGRRVGFSRELREGPGVCERVFSKMEAGEGEKESGGERKKPGNQVVSKK